MDPGTFAWISRSPIAAWVNSSGLIWPTLESIHFVSLCVLVGSLLIIDLRLIGFYRERCAPTVEALVRLSLLAFGVNFLTGALFFAGNTPKYLNNSAFTLKLILIALAGLNAIYYRVRLSSLVDTNEVTRASIGVGYLSLFLWTGVIICGRMITFYAR
ncbi:MAG: hypothetical protein HKN84_10925 [Gammaproteobacteria bacterium]|nr:hypothetical protein [Gammaproteobacteria bacterium]